MHLNLRASQELNFSVLTAIFEYEGNKMAKKSKRKTTKCANCQKLEKENKRLKRSIVRMTKSKDGKPVKQIHFDEKDLAKRFGMSVKTMQNWRHKGIGPKWEKMGRSIRYRLRDIVAFEKSLPTRVGFFE